MKQDIIVALKLTLICFIAVLLLSVVNLFTSKKIKLATELSIEKSNKELFPEGTNFKRRLFSENPLTSDSNEIYYEVYNKTGNIIGYITSITGTGFGGDLPLLIAFNKELKIINLKLLKNSETPGFGKKWENQKTMNMFVDTNTKEKPFPTKKSMLPQDFLDTPHGVTGATITFNGITEAVSKAIKLMEQQ